MLKNEMLALASKFATEAWRSGLSQDEVMVAMGLAVRMLSIKGQLTGEPVSLEQVQAKLSEGFGLFVRGISITSEGGRTKEHYELDDGSLVLASKTVVPIH